MSKSAPSKYRFRPRFRLLALSAVFLGALLVGATMALNLAGDVYALAAGITGITLGLLYLASPAWRIEVVLDDSALAVVASGKERFRLPWSEIVRVVASPATHTCFVDGGQPEHSLLVPGPGASAPYDIENKKALYEAIVARVPDERIEEVEALADAQRGDAGAGDAPAGGDDSADGDAPAAGEETA